MPSRTERHREMAETGIREHQALTTASVEGRTLVTRAKPPGSGWAQVLYWGGTSGDGQVFDAQEVDVFTTDDDFDVTRYEIYSDAKQWRDILKFLHGWQLPSAGYGELIAQEPGSVGKE